MKRLGLLALIAAALGGCVAVPVVEPYPAYIAPAVVVGPHHYGHGYRHWRRWH